MPHTSRPHHRMCVPCHRGTVVTYATCKRVIAGSRKELTMFLGWSRWLCCVVALCPRARYFTWLCTLSTQQKLGTRFRNRDAWCERSASGPIIGTRGGVYAPQGLENVFGMNRSSDPKGLLREVGEQPWVGYQTINIPLTSLKRQLCKQQSTKTQHHLQHNGRLDYVDFHSLDAWPTL